jgi:hypothetical protein
VWGAKYLVAQNRELVQQLTASHVGYQGKLESLTREHAAMIRENTKATAEQSELLRQHSSVMRAAAKHLERLEGKAV